MMIPWEESGKKVLKRARRKVFFLRLRPLFILPLLAVLYFLIPHPSTPTPPTEEELQVIIQKINSHVLITWNGEPSGVYEVQKCTLTPRGFECQEKTVVKGNQIKEPIQNTQPLIVYRVRPLRS